MMRKLVFALLLLAAFATSAWNPSPHKTYNLEVINQTDLPVIMFLGSPARHYFLYVPAEETREYKVVGGGYEHSTHFCNTVQKGELEMGKSIRLNFTGCDYPSPNRGEGRASEKISPFLTENKKNWVYSIE
jgi:hypothetical protein